MDFKEARDFLTIKKEIYNHFLGRMSEKTIRFYSGLFLPPTIKYTMNTNYSASLPEIPKILGLEKKDIPEDIKEKFKDNIEIQEEVMRVVKKRNEKYNYRCGLIKLTTGKGKSHIIIDITEYYQTNTLILVHNVKTLGELCQKFVNFTNIKPSVYGGGKKEIGKITIMTKKSFILDYQEINQEFGLVLVDEAPVQFSKKFWDATNKFFHKKDGIAFYGLSGTPKKIELDENDLQKYFGKIIEVKGQENNGYNYIPKITMYDYKYKGFYEYENPSEMRTAISENKERLAKQVEEIRKIIWKRNCLLVLTDRKNEIENFYTELMGTHGEYFLFCMTGDTKQKDDEENINLAKQLLKDGGKVIIIGTIQKVGIGVDIPFIDSIFLASAIKFESTVIQAIGRGLRKHEGKEDVFVGVWNDIGILNNQKTEKIKSIQKEYGIEKENITFIKL